MSAKYCAICGHLLYHAYQIAAEIKGDFTDYNLREIGTIDIQICAECWAKICEIDVGGVEAARRRSEDLRIYDAEKKEK